MQEWSPVHTSGSTQKRVRTTRLPAATIFAQLRPDAALARELAFAVGDDDLEALLAASAAPRAGC